MAARIAGCALATICLAIIQTDDPALATMMASRPCSVGISIPPLTAFTVTVP
jgi:hypothetical protein